MVIKSCCGSALQEAGTELSQPVLPISLLWPLSMAQISSPTWDCPSKATLGRAVAVLYIILNPLLSPLMYILRTKDVKAALSRFKSWYLFS